MAAFKKTLSGDSRYSITLTVTEKTVTNEDIALNRTRVDYKLEATKSSGSGYHTSNKTNPVKVTLGGTEVVNKKVAYDFTGSTPKTITLASGTKPIQHNPDGTKTIACSGYFGDANNSLGNATASGNLTLTNIPRQSTLSTDEDAYNIGDTVSITMTKYVNTYKHTLGYTIDNNSYVLLDKQSNDTYSWPIPAVLANNITTNPPTKNITLYLRTYDGDKEIGTSQKTLAITVPINTYKPGVSISTPTEADATMISKNWGVFVQNKSKLSYSITNTKNRGANIISTTSTADGKSYTGTSVTTSVLTNSGTGTISASSTDTRGAVGTATKTYSVVAYSNPSITLSSAQRCLSNGTLDSNGTYIKYSFKASISSVSGHNSGTYKLCYKKTSDSTYTEVTVGTGTSINITDAVSTFTISTDYEYDIMFTVTDAFTTIPVEQKLESGFDLMNFNASGKSMAIGKVSQATASEKKLEVALDTEFSGTVNFTSSNALDMLYSYISNILIGLFNSLGSSDALWDNLPKTTETGTNIELNNSIEAPIRIKLNASETTQDTTTGKNLLNVNATSETKNGITMVVNNDKTITLNGTNTGSTTWFRLAPDFTLQAGTYTLSNGDDSRIAYTTALFVDDAHNFGYITSTKTFTSAVTIQPYIRIQANAVLNNLIIKPMIESGSNYTGFEKYTGTQPSPSPNYPQPIETTTGRNVIEICGKNLANNNFEDYDITDGSYAILPIELEYGKTYVLKATLVGEKKAQYYNFGVVKDGTNYSTFVGFNDCIRYSDGEALTKTFTIDSTYTNPKLVCFIQKSQTKFNELFTNYHIQLEKSSSATTYEPYIGNSYEVNLGKNLVSFENLTDATNFGVEISYNKSEIRLNGTTNQSGTFIPYTNLNIPLSAGTYTMSYRFGSGTASRGSGQDIAFILRDKNDNNLNTTTIGQILEASTGVKAQTFTLSNSTTLKFYAYCNNSGVVLNNIVMQVQLEKGNQATSYSPYFEPIELCKIGNYQDRLFKASGKNLYDKDSSLNGTISQSDGITISANNSILYTPNYIEVIPSTQYTFSCNETGISVRMFYYDSNKVYLNTAVLSVGGTSGSITIPNNAYYMRCQHNISFTNMQLEIGTTATSYEPYGNYWYKYNAIGKVVLNGSENYSNQSGEYDTTTRMMFSVNPSSIPQNMTNRKAVCNYFINYNGSVQNRNVDVTAFNFNNSPQYSNFMYFKLEKSVLPTQDATGFKNWVASHNLIVYYQLATPTYTKIENEELIGQLEDLKNAHSYNKITNIMQENSELPFILEVDVIDLQNLT